KIQMQLMNKNLWGIVNGKETAPTDASKLLEWQSRDDRAKAIIGLALSDSELHHVDLDKSSKEIWDTLNKLFGAKAVNAKFSLKLQLYRFKMDEGVSMSSHINNLRSLIRQLAEVKAAIEDEDAKAILLNSLSSKYSNVVFTLSQIQSQSLDDMIAALLAEEKRTTEDAEGHSQQESAFYSRTRKYRRRSDKDKSEIECHYCKKRGHTTWDCRVRANDVLKGKVISNTANIAMVEDPPDAE
ncbi:hypothetical protein KI387_043468, partial [Taxus chinensis]